MIPIVLVQMCRNAFVKYGAAGFWRGFGILVLWVACPACIDGIGVLLSGLQLCVDSTTNQRPMKARLFLMGKAGSWRSRSKQLGGLHGKEERYNSNYRALLRRGTKCTRQVLHATNRVQVVVMTCSSTALFFVVVVRAFSKRYRVFFCFLFSHRFRLDSFFSVRGRRSHTDDCVGKIGNKNTVGKNRPCPFPKIPKIRNQGKKKKNALVQNGPQFSRQFLFCIDLISVVQCQQFFSTPLLPSKHPRVCSQVVRKQRFHTHGMTWSIRKRLRTGNNSQTGLWGGRYGRLERHHQKTRCCILLRLTQRNVTGLHDVLHCFTHFARMRRYVKTNDMHVSFIHSTDRADMTTPMPRCDTQSQLPPYMQAVEVAMKNRIRKVTTLLHDSQKTEPIQNWTKIYLPTMPYTLKMSFEIGDQQHEAHVRRMLVYGTTC